MKIPSVLEKIVATKIDEVEQRKSARPIIDLADRLDAPRGFKRALVDSVERGKSAVIAEIKKASPSKGVIRPNFDVVEIAKDYERSGAACLSCLTDETYFQGGDDYLRAARAATSLPVLRKDFVIDAYQVDESFVLGADCVLLIAAILPQTTMNALYLQAVALGLDVLIEVHDQAECEAALALSPMMLGINNRNLHDFSVDLGTTHRLLDQIPSDTLVVTESGISAQSDVSEMRAAGIHAFLVGEAFMREPSPGAALSELFE